MTRQELRPDLSGWKVQRQVSGPRSQPPRASRARGKRPDSTSCKQRAAEATRAWAGLDPGRACVEPGTAPGPPLKRGGAPGARSSSTCRRASRNHISRRRCGPDPRVQAQCLRRCRLRRAEDASGEPGRPGPARSPHFRTPPRSPLRACALGPGPKGRIALDGLSSGAKRRELPVLGPQSGRAAWLLGAVSPGAMRPEALPAGRKGGRAVRVPRSPGESAGGGAAGAPGTWSPARRGPPRKWRGPGPALPAAPGPRRRVALEP